MQQHAAELLPMVLGAIGVLLAMLVGVVAWLFQRVWAMLGQIFGLLRELERELRGDMLDHERRISALEGQCQACRRRSTD